MDVDPMWDRFNYIDSASILPPLELADCNSVERYTSR
jgi:hypothetical protein